MTNPTESIDVGEFDYMPAVVVRLTHAAENLPHLAVEWRDEPTAHEICAVVRQMLNAADRAEISTYQLNVTGAEMSGKLEAAVRERLAGLDDGSMAVTFDAEKITKLESGHVG